MSIKTTLIQGRAKWAKILGAAPPGYDNGPAEWTLDLVLDDKGQKEFLASGADSFYLREDPKTGDKFVKFSRKAVRKDGTEAKPIKILDQHGEEWNQGTLIGNGSVLNIQYTLNDVRSKGVQRWKPSILAVQVWEHQKYAPKNDFPVAPKPTIVDATGDAEPAW